MKNILLYISFIAILLSACTEDKGTYEYKDLNEVVITGVSPFYSVLNGTSLVIEPEIKQKQIQDESRLKYLWFSYNVNAQIGKADTLAFTKNLNIDSIELAPESYLLVFRVTDIITGVFYDQNSILTVKGFPDGLHVLSNSAGNAQLSILRGEEELCSFEAYKEINGEIAGVNPIGVSGINEFMRWGKPIRFIILCSDGGLGVYTDGSTFEKTITVRDAFINITAPETVKGLIGKHNTRSFVTGIFGEGNLYTTFQPGGAYGPECSFRYVFNDFSEKFMAPVGSNFMLYNTATKGFYTTDNWGSKMSYIPPSDSLDVPFDVANTGLDVIYGKNAGAYSMGVFIDSGTNQRYILALSGAQAYLKIELTSENINSATLFEFMNTKQVMYYVHENIIYTYDVIAKKVLYTYELPSGKVVDYMEIAEDDKSLYVAFSDGSNTPKAGSVHILALDMDGEILEARATYENKFGQVVDFLENY